MIIPKKKIFKSGLFFTFLTLFFTIIWIIIRDPENFENCWAENRKNCGDDPSLEKLWLPSGEPSSVIRSVMLLEGHYNDHLSPRMLCTIESAAVSHPDVAVNVMMTSRVLKLSPVTKRIMATYRNVRIFHLNTTALYFGSPFEEWFRQEKWRESLWPKSHFNDIIRWMVLWKYGGVYLDMDVIVLQNLMKTENFSALESDKWVGAGALGFAPHHPVVEACLLNMIKNFDGKVWGSNGPELLTNTLILRCGMELPYGKMKNCSDIKIYDTKSFYPIPWWEWHLYLKDNINKSTAMLKDSEILGLHLWNFHIHHFPVDLFGGSLFAVAARRACPEIVAEVGKKF